VPAREVPARLVHVQADLGDAAARRALGGVDVLYHVGAQVWQGEGKAGLERMRRANVDGSRNVVAARPGALVLASSAAVYGAWPSNPLPLRETHWPRPNDECPYAQQKLLAERVCLEGHDRSAVVRLAAVLGPHADARVTRAVQGYRWAVPAVRGVTQAVQWLDEQDAVRGLLLAGRALTGGPAGGPDVAGEVFNLATGDWLDAHDVAGIAGGRVLTLPRRALVLASELSRWAHVTPFGADRAALIGGPLALSIEKAGRLLGWEPRCSSSEVLRAALQQDWQQLPRNRRR
jgi:nucleoside-diphosphate-sugar epimerase